jgi:hypothetical protein
MSSASVLFFLRPSLRCLITAAARALKSRGPECNRSANSTSLQSATARPRARQTSRKRQFWKRRSRSCRTWKTLHRPAWSLWYETILRAVAGFAIWVAPRRRRHNEGALSPHYWRHPRGWRWRWHSGGLPGAQPLVDRHTHRQIKLCTNPPGCTLNCAGIARGEKTPLSYRWSVVDT